MPSDTRVEMRGERGPASDGDRHLRRHPREAVREAPVRGAPGFVTWTAVLRDVTATASSRSAAQATLKERLMCRPGYGSGGVLSLSSPFGDLAELWLADLALRDLAEGTKDG